MKSCSMPVPRLPSVEDMAEGTCLDLPYNTELVSANGCTVHFWCGPRIDEDHLKCAIALIRADRDIVGVTCPIGAPTGF